MIYFESPYRILKSVKQIIEILGENQQVVVARELTKMNEEMLQGTSREIYEELFGKGSIKGDTVLLIGKASLENT